MIHTHSTHLVALTLAGVWSEQDILPPITPYYVMKVGHVPLLPYHRPGDPQVGTLVAQAIGAAQVRGVPIRAVMLDRLGPNVWHESPARGDGHAGRAGRNRAAVAADETRAADRRPPR